MQEVCSGLSQTKASLIEFSSACSEEGKKDEKGENERNVIV